MRATLFAVSGLLVVTLAYDSARADEPFTVTIPGQGWAVTFTAPPLRQYQGQTKDKTFVFQGVDEKGFTISMFVEEPKDTGTGNEAVSNYYWPLAKHNPLIDPRSVEKEKMPKFVKVTYFVKAGTATALNANYYFEFQGHWVDLHMSRFPSATNDLDKLAEFENSLVYELSKDKTK